MSCLCVFLWQHFIFYIFSGPIGWCQLAYWELAERVGPQFPVRDSIFNIFSEQVLHGDGLCLTTLAQQRCTQPNESVLKTRGKIGLGKCPWPHINIYTVSEHKHRSKYYIFLALTQKKIVC